MYLNIQGLTSHKVQLNWIINQNRPKIICLSETHVTKDFTKNEIKIEGYNSICSYSKSAHTGGTLIYVKKGLKYKMIKNMDDNMNMWLTGIEIKVENEKCFIYSIYHSPSSSHAEFLDKLDELFETIQLDGIIVMVGDFNIDMAGSSFYEGKLKTLIRKYGFYQVVEKCTRITKDSATKIDLVLTNKKNLKNEVHSTPKITDHSIITINMMQESTEKNNVKIFRNYKNMDVLQYQLSLINRHWPPNCSECDILADNLTTNLIELLNEFAPEKEKVIGQKWGNKMWWNQEIDEQIKIRDQFYQKAINTITDEDWNIYKRQRNRIVTLIRTSKVRYYDEKIDQNKQNSTEMWKTLKSIVNEKNQDSIKNEIIFNGVVVEKDICERFNEHFLNSIDEIVKNIHPSKTHVESISHIESDKNLEEFCMIEMSELRKTISNMKNKESNIDGITVQILKYAFETIGDKILNLINKSLRKGTFPRNWKTSTVVPIEKITGTINSEEFRPINIVAPYEKLLELCVNKQIVQYLETNNILSEYQAGFRNNNSCESALQTLIFHWKDALEEGKMIGIVFLDFRRAFETINRNLLILKMEKYGFGQNILKWFRDYLSERSQVTRYGQTSTASESIHGVPQGTVLGPTLFILYINDIVKVIENCKIQMFADDTLLYVMGENIDEITQKLNNDLIHLSDWLNNNSLQLNINKTKSMVIRNRTHNCNLNLVNFNVKIDDEKIERVNEFKYLGCILDEYLNFSSHFKYITGKMAKKINIMSRISKCLSPWAKLTIYKTIIAPHLYFCPTVLFLMNNSEMDVMQKKQNIALRIILRCNKFTSRIYMLNLTNLLSVKQTITHNTMIFIYKMLNDLLPRHLLKNCKFVREVHEYNTRARDNFYINKVNTNFSQNNLFFKGLKLYNELPNEVKCCDTLVKFKNLCREYIKQKL